TVTDAGGNPLKGLSVTFTAPASGAGGAFVGNSTVTTNVQGMATAPAFAGNSVAGSYTITATTSGVAPVAFSLTNTPGPPASIIATAGISQSAAISTAFTTALQAT